MITVDPGEGCDLAASVNSDAPDAVCRPNCQPQRCGDGILDPGYNEVCDDGNTVDGDCKGDCSGP